MPPRSRVLTHDRFRAPPPEVSEHLRQLQALRDVTHALLTADRPEQVLQFALERTSPLVSASFASVFLIDGASELMRLAASHNWPEHSRPWLAQARVRLGFGPSGESAAERRAIEVPDVFADPDLEDWQEVATELGFRSIVSLPLQTTGRVLGAATFYFATAGVPSAETRAILRLVTDLLAATAEKAALVDDFRRSESALREAHEEIEHQTVSLAEARLARDDFAEGISRDLRAPLSSVLGYIALMQEEIPGPLTGGQREDLGQVRRSTERILRLIDDLHLLAAAKRGDLEATVEEFDPRQVLRDAIRAWPSSTPSVQLRVSEPALVPQMRSDRGKVHRVLVSLLENAFKFTASGEVVVSLEIAGDRAAFRVRDTGIGIPASAQGAVFDEFRRVQDTAVRRPSGPGIGLTLSRRLARFLGGDVVLISAPGTGSTFSLELPLDVDQGRASGFDSPFPNDSSRP